MINKEIKFRNETIKVDIFEKKDFKSLKEIFKKWIELNKKLKELNGRSMNVPDVLSEGLFCLLFNAYRTRNSAHSYDAVDIKRNKGIQLKSSSILNDLSSFGPKSTWDELYFIDFAPEGKINGEVHFYKVDNEIQTVVLNYEKTRLLKHNKNKAEDLDFL
ncbi:Bsp6I family type II restriction endonuclease [Mycoplasma struthionis]|uniref:Bsp6I family type II restriction endonuclease n=1 Tax=Mycoplasma struthionis TaxID=538220 RepID=UPI0021BD5F16|nr:Bsp6I family type II restriction endonuclease [Mycoplasma struthionis]